MFTKQLILASLFVTSIAHAQSPAQRALSGLSTTASLTISERAAVPSFFRAELRAAFSRSASGEGVFGAALAADQTPAAFVISLGACSPESAILFTRMSGVPLDVGRYRISEDANSSDEVLALVVTGPPTRATGAFRGRSGWLEVTALSDQFLSGRFEIDAVGFVASEPEADDRRVQITGSFAAMATASSGPICETK